VLTTVEHNVLVWILYDISIAWCGYHLTLAYAFG